MERIGRGLPATALAPQIRSWTGLRGVVMAPPGTGKTTVVPPLVADLLTERPGAGQRVIVTQPRRIAARSAARRLASLTGTAPGGLAGYTVRGDRKAGPTTRVEFVTTGVLLRRMLQDPDLPGVGAVVLDEVHERHLDSDLAFAMLRQLVELREDLGLLAMSATVDAQRWAELLGEEGHPAPIARAEAPLHPLTEEWAPHAGPVQDARGVTDAFLAHVARTVQSHAPQGSPGDTLVFLPGQREIDRVAGILRRAGAAVHVLTGRTPAREQDTILAPAGTPAGAEAGTGRIILATNVAESALTVPGVRRVVDAGLDRQQRLDTVRGMSGLVTVGASKAAMTQRAGRAAREAPGTVVRCMNGAEHAARPAHTPPEITTADLTGAILDLACWGAPGGEGLRLPDLLPERSAAMAQATLQALGAVTAQGRATALGHRLAEVPADPRLARGLFDGAELVGARPAAEVVAALSGDLRAPGGDLEALLRGLRRDGDRTWKREARRLEQVLASPAESEGADSTGAGSEDVGSAGAGRGPGPSADRRHGEAETARGVKASGGAKASGGMARPRGGVLPAPTAGPVAGLVTALAFPERIARRRPGSEGEYLLASGTGAELPRDSVWAGQEWLAVAEVGLSGGRALIRAAAGIDRETAELAAGSLLVREETGTFHHGKVAARAVTRLGAIELSSTPVPPSPETGRHAVAAALAEQGLLDFLHPAEGFHALRNRLGVLHRVLGEPWPAVDLHALEETAEDWLGSELEQIATGTPVARIDATSALRRLLPWPEAARLDELAPERIRVPSGSQVQLAWPEPEEHDAQRVAPPVLAVKLQECFGWEAGPLVCEGRVPVQLHLLSPARRPLAVTQDLHSFWENVYPQVRAENRGKYIRHPWPEDPWNAVPTARTTRRAARD